MAAPASAGEAMLGVYQHDIDDTFSFGHKEHGKQIVVGVRTAALDELSFIWRPRAHLIAGVNTAGGTDYVAAGLSWRFNFGGDRFYFSPGIGVAVHNGSINLPSPYDPGLSPAEQQRRLYNWEHKLDLGSRVLFEPEWSLGWRATDRLSLELSWIHMSHAQLAGQQNPGLGDFGVRAVYRYGADRGRPETRTASSYPSPPRSRLPVNPPDVALAQAETRSPVNRPDVASDRLPVNPPDVPAQARADLPVSRRDVPSDRLPVNRPDMALAEQAAPPPPADPPPAPVLRAASLLMLSPAAPDRKGGGSVQIAASATPQGAERALGGIKGVIAGWGTPPDGRVEKAVVHGAVVYRALVDGFEDAMAAESFCSSLRSSGRDCFVRSRR
jgi:lipid A 3-O-deacylase